MSSAETPSSSDVPKPGDAAAPYLEPYREVVERVGPSFEALLWRNREYQERRFKTIAEAVNLTGRVVADLGCGQADFAAWLHKAGVEYGRYIGVDGIPALVESCVKRAEDEGIPETDFVEADFVAEDRCFSKLVKKRKAEVFVFSGSLNTLEQPLAERVLDRAWEAIRRVRSGALVFNFLSDRTHGKGKGETGPAHRYDTVRMVGWALDRTPRVVLRHDYLDGHDGTVLMFGER